MREYAVIYEEGPTSWGAYVPDLPICVAVGKTQREVAERIREAVALYIESLQEDGLPVPTPRFQIGTVSVAA